VGPFLFMGAIMTASDSVPSALVALTDGTTKLTLNSDGSVNNSITTITAAKLAKGAQSRVTITCTNANTDYPAAAVIPDGTKYLALYCASDFRVAVDEATAAGVGPTVAGGQGVVWALTFGADGGDSKVHVQSPTAGAVVEVVYLT
jgi:hypothetical protein